jgi:anti-sigma regulatory factor (Ser/Thr protein kinase)
MDLSSTGTLTQVLAIEDLSQVGHARRTVQQLAARSGFDETDAGRAALVATELTSNVLKHATRGTLHLRLVPGRDAVGIELVAVDRGPGFDLAHCVTDGYSTGGTQGIGLGALARQAQVFDVYADGRGAVVLARLYPRGAARNVDVHFGVSQQAMAGEAACGDTWRLAIDGQRLSALMIDGLGHGQQAEHAALAGAGAFDQDPFGSPSTVLERMHQRMSGTRGGAVALAQLDVAGTLHYVGIGNIAGSLIAAESSRGLASHPGIVGGQFRKTRVFDYPDATGQLLIMHSDGLQTRWRVSDYPGLWHRHPAVIAALLQRDFCRGRDDVSVLVVALEKRRG